MPNTLNSFVKRRYAAIYDKVLLRDSTEWEEWAYDKL